MKTISENDLQPQENPGDGWFIIEAAGDHPHVYTLGEEKVEFTLHLPPEVLAAVAEAGVPAEGVLVDLDHLSHDPASPTQAYGWLRELAMCGDNLAGLIQWTPLGAPLVAGRIYRHFSTEYDTQQDAIRSGVVTPTRLSGLALTNRPANAQGQPAITSRASHGAAPLPTEENNHKHHTKTMNPEIIAALGLPEDATDADILAAIADLKAAAENAAAAEADALVESEEASCGVELTPEEKEEIIDELLTNRATGEKILRLTCRCKANDKPAASRQYQDRSNRSSKTATHGDKPNASSVQVMSRAKELCNEARKQGRHLGFWTAKAQAERELSAK